MASTRRKKSKTFDESVFMEVEDFLDEAQPVDEGLLLKKPVTVKGVDYAAGDRIHVRPELEAWLRDQSIV